jgi:hypothetical protein
LGKQMGVVGANRAVAVEIEARVSGPACLHLPGQREGIDDRWSFQVDRPGG